MTQVWTEMAKGRPQKPPGNRQGKSPEDVRRRKAIHFVDAGLTHHRAGRIEQALADYGRAVALNPHSAQAYNNLGVALRTRGNPEAALASYRRAVALAPDDAGIYSNMGNVLRTLGRHEEAVASLHRSLELNSTSPDTFRNLGLVLRDLGKLDEALECFARARQLRPDHPDTELDRAYALLLAGDIRRGFEAYEWRWKINEAVPRNFPEPLWDGSDLAGRTILLYAEQGFGDTIQFARYVPRVADRGGRIVLECQPDLIRLLQCLPGIGQFVAKGKALPSVDVQAPLVSLPWLFGTTIETIPENVPYLAAPSQARRLEAATGDQLKVGFAWGGSPTHRNDRNRSCPVEHFVGLTDRPDILFYSLQKGGRAKDLDTHGARGLVSDLNDHIRDFADTAAIIQQLDLVITVDTSVGHLAGALAKPVWVLLPNAPDWRWMRDRDDSPWYLTMRLFRQETWGDWPGVFERVRQELDGFAPS